MRPPRGVKRSPFAPDEDGTPGEQAINPTIRSTLGKTPSRDNSSTSASTTTHQHLSNPVGSLTISSTPEHINQCSVQASVHAPSESPLSHFATSPKTVAYSSYASNSNTDNNVSSFFEGGHKEPQQTCAMRRSSSTGSSASVYVAPMPTNLRRPSGSGCHHEANMNEAATYHQPSSDIPLDRGDSDGNWSEITFGLQSRSSSLTSVSSRAYGNASTNRPRGSTNTHEADSVPSEVFHSSYHPTGMNNEKETEIADTLTPPSSLFGPRAPLPSDGSSTSTHRRSLSGSGLIKAIKGFSRTTSSRLSPSPSQSEVPSTPTQPYSPTNGPLSCGSSRRPSQQSMVSLSAMDVGLLNRWSWLLDGLRNPRAPLSEAILLTSATSMDDSRMARSQSCLLTHFWTKTVTLAFESLNAHKQAAFDANSGKLFRGHKPPKSLFNDPLLFLGFLACEKLNLRPPPAETATTTERHLFGDLHSWTNRETQAVESAIDLLKSGPLASALRYPLTEYTFASEVHRRDTVAQSSDVDCSEFDNVWVDQVNRELMLRFLYYTNFDVKAAAQFSIQHFIWRSFNIPLVFSRGEWKTLLQRRKSDRSHLKTVNDGQVAYAVQRALLERPLLSSVYFSGRDKYARPLLVMRMAPLISAIAGREDLETLFSAFRKLLVLNFEIAMNFILQKRVCEKFVIIQDFRGISNTAVRDLLEDEGIKRWTQDVIFELREAYPIMVHSIFILGLDDDVIMKSLTDTWWQQWDVISGPTGRSSLYAQIDAHHVRAGRHEILPLSNFFDLSQLEISAGGSRVNFGDWAAFVNWIRAISGPVKDEETIESRFKDVTRFSEKTTRSANRKKSAGELCQNAGSSAKRYGQDDDRTSGSHLRTSTSTGEKFRDSFKKKMGWRN